MKKTVYYVYVMLSLILLSSCNNTSSTNTTTFVKESTIQTTTENLKVNSQFSKKNFKKSCKPFIYENIIRNPKKHLGKKYKFLAKVISIHQEHDTEYHMRLHSTKFAEYYDFPGQGYVYAIISLDENDDRIFENDIITVYGKSNGEYTYTSVGEEIITLPLIDVFYYDLEDKGKLTHTFDFKNITINYQRYGKSFLKFTKTDL